MNGYDDTVARELYRVNVAQRFLAAKIMGKLSCFQGHLILTAAKMLNEDNNRYGEIADIIPWIESIRADIDRLIKEVG
jgi:hypothetical protein